MELNQQLLEKIKYGEDLIESTLKFDHVDGLRKLHRKINQELSFLKKIYHTNRAKKEYLECSNLTHFGAVIDTLKVTGDSNAVCQTFLYHDKKINVDIISNNGFHWVKVIARNPKALSQISMGDSRFGTKSILDQATEFKDCAKMYPRFFQPPVVKFVFTNGVAVRLAKQLEALGVIVVGDRICDKELGADTEDSSDKEEDIIEPTPSYSNYAKISTNNINSISRVNLDVSAMLAYCSNVTNGSAQKYRFTVPVLAQQALWETQKPQKPILDKFFEGKKLYCCETAKENFINIVNTVGGASEKQRAKEFVKRLTVLPDDASMDDPPDDVITTEVFRSVQYTNSKSLILGGKIRQRSLTIFNFGDNIKAVTVTANEGFIRAARQQGINYVVFLHESRALTEQKEEAKGNLLY